VLREARSWVWSTLAGLALCAAVTWLAFDASAASIRMSIVTLALCLVLALAEGARGRRDRYRAMSREIAARRQSAAATDRVRIARELHDILAHSLSQISVQAGVGLHLFDSQPERARESLAAIRATSGSALDEVREVLGQLRDSDADAEHAPEPSLTRLPEL